MLCIGCVEWLFILDGRVQLHIDVCSVEVECCLYGVLAVDFTTISVWSVTSYWLCGFYHNICLECDFKLAAWFLP